MGQEYDAQDALLVAHKAYVKLVADLAAESKLPTEAQKQAYLDNYVKYLNLREPLDGEVYQIVVDGKDVRLADNLKAADWGTKFLDTDLENVRNAADLTMYSGSIPMGMSYMDKEYAKQGVLPMWRELSTILWGMDNLRISVDTEIGDDFNVIVDGLGDVYIADLGEVRYNLGRLGYYTVTNPNDDEQFSVKQFASSLWWAYIAETARIQNMEAAINNQEEVEKLIAYFDEQIEKYEEEYAEMEGVIDEYIDADKEMEEAIEAIIAEYNEFVDEKKAPILERKVALADEMLQMQMLVAKYTAEVEATQELHEHYMTMINAYYMLFSEDLNSPESLDELEDAIAGIIAGYEEDIIGLSEDLNDAKKALLELRNGTDGDTVVYEQELDRLTDKVEQIEAEIDARLADIEYYEDLLKKTLDVFAGVAEGEGGSEA